jgi:hypothetical protein
MQIIIVFVYYFMLSWNQHRRKMSVESSFQKWTGRTFRGKEVISCVPFFRLANIYSFAFCESQTNYYLLSEFDRI